MHFSLFLYSNVIEMKSCFTLSQRESVPSVDFGKYVSNSYKYVINAFFYHSMLLFKDSFHDICLSNIIDVKKCPPRSKGDFVIVVAFLFQQKCRTL